MRFYIRKRRQTPTVIIVALIDVLIVPLIFLMVTTTFKQQPALKLALPESSTALKSGTSENAPLVVAVTTNGQFFLGTDKLPVTTDRLKNELVARAQTNSQLKVAISADKGAPVGQFFKVMDAVRGAGIKTVDAFAKEAGKP